MIKNAFRGILFSGVGSLWWGVIGVLYFKSVSFVDPIELIVHRTVWTAFLLIFTISIYSKWNDVFLILRNIKKTLILFFSGILIVTNWFTWIYAVVTNRLVDASFGYYIFPILSVYWGSVFLGEKLNIKKKISIFIIILSIIYMMYFLEEFPWIGLVVAFSFSFYAVLRKIVMVETDVGLFIESIFLIPIIIFIFYNLNIENEIVFNLKNLELSLILILAGPMTVIPLFLFVKGSELSGLGNASMIFFVAPTGQFLLGLFLYNEAFMINKLIGFILIWFAVLIYLLDLYENN